MVGMETYQLKKTIIMVSLQSGDYFNEFINKDENNLDILEIGSSWGYFLNVCRKEDIIQ